MGVAIGTLVTALIEFTLVIYPISLKTINVRHKTLLRHSLRPSVIPALAVIAFTLGAEYFIDEFSLLLLLLSCLTSIGVFVIIYSKSKSVGFERGVVVDTYVSFKAIFSRVSQE